MKNDFVWGPVRSSNVPFRSEGYCDFTVRRSQLFSLPSLSFAAFPIMQYLLFLKNGLQKSGTPVPKDAHPNKSTDSTPSEQCSDALEHLVAQLCSDAA